jgi:glutathione peroxidase
MQSIYEIDIRKLDGSPLDWQNYKDKFLLIVNVASECGYTPQYSQLQELYVSMGDKVSILGVPCNDFGGQEPGKPEEIAAFCELNYDITFTLTEKVGIKNQTHPLYQWLTQKADNHVSDAIVAWNFHKFLIGKDGQWIADFPSDVPPLAEEIISIIHGK